MSWNPWRLRAACTAAVVVLLALGCASTPSPEGMEPRGEADAEDGSRRARLHHDMGVDHLNHGQTALALRELLEAERQDPEDKWIQLALAEAYRRKGRLGETEKHLKAALAIDPAFQQAHLNLAALYVQLERYAESIPHTRFLIDDPTYPSIWQAHNNLGWAEFKLGRTDAARENFQLALDYREDFWRAHLNLGILEAVEGNRREALKHFEKVLEQEPGPLEEAETHFHMAVIFVSLGRREEALRHFSQAAEQRPSGPWGKRSEEYLERLQ